MFKSTATLSPAHVLSDAFCQFLKRVGLYRLIAEQCLSHVVERIAFGERATMAAGTEICP
jgi:hypothetical protein